MNRREMLGNVAKGVAVGAAALITSCHTDEPEPTPTPKPTPEPTPEPTPKCYPEQLPELTIINETEKGKNDGIITNSNNYPVEVSPTDDFSSDNFILQPGATKESMTAGNYHARWAANGTCDADSRIVDITIEEGVVPPLDIDKVEPYTEGSNQEWVLWALAQVGDSAEKIRLYNYLLRAHTYLMRDDKNDYTAEYNAGKADLELRIKNASNETTRKILQAMLNDENWPIECRYPVKNPFRADYETMRQVGDYLRDASPQFFLYAQLPRLYDAANGQSVGLGIPAYYAFANRRQQTHEKILNGFNSFKSQLEKAKVNTNNRYDVAKYVYDDVTKTLTYDDDQRYDYVTRVANENQTTILCYFSDSKRTICNGYSKILSYFQNSFGVPTICQIGIRDYRDEKGNIINSAAHGWNMVQMENNEWYLQDATTDRGAGSNKWFLIGEESNGSEFPGGINIPADNMIYPKCAIKDYSVPVRSIQAPALATSGPARR